MYKTIAFFNHKGGVSKTTTAFGLGWMLAEKGNKVVLVDADPQCNLSGLVLGDGLDDFYANNPNRNIYEGLKPAFESQPRAIEAIQCVSVGSRRGLYLLPGHVRLSEYEVMLGISHELSGSIPALMNLPGAFHFLISKIAERIDANYVLIDMNPSLGSINQNFLLSSDYFLVPTSPDYFNLMAIDSLTAILPRWADWAEKMYESKALKDAIYPFPKPNLKFLGTVIQKYRLRSGEATAGFQNWIDDINARVKEDFVPQLQSRRMTLAEADYISAGTGSEKDYCLAQIPDFNTLVATSQSNRTPVFALTDMMFGHVGTVLTQDQAKREEFYEIFNQLADCVIQLSQCG